MRFYLTLKTNTELTHVPFLDSIGLLVNGEEKTYTWDNSEGYVEKSETDGLTYVCYRLKGVSYLDADDEWQYANGTMLGDIQVEIDPDCFIWQEDDDAEECEFEVAYFEIEDYDEESNCDVEIVVVGEK